MEFPFLKRRVVYRVVGSGKKEALRFLQGFVKG
jgi:hypothetical protein